MIFVRNFYTSDVFIFFEHLFVCRDIKLLAVSDCLLTYDALVKLFKYRHSNQVAGFQSLLNRKRTNEDHY
jgi:hypothetical protein